MTDTGKRIHGILVHYTQHNDMVTYQGPSAKAFSLLCSRVDYQECPLTEISSLAVQVTSHSRTQIISVGPESPLVSPACVMSRWRCLFKTFKATFSKVVEIGIERATDELERGCIDPDDEFLTWMVYLQKRIHVHSKDRHCIKIQGLMASLGHKLIGSIRRMKMHLRLEYRISILEKIVDEATNDLLEYLKDSSSLVRANAAKSLGKVLYNISSESEKQTLWNQLLLPLLNVRQTSRLLLGTGIDTLVCNNQAAGTLLCLAHYLYLDRSTTKIHSDSFTSIVSSCLLFRETRVGNRLVGNDVRQMALFLAWVLVRYHLSGSIDTGSDLIDETLVQNLFLLIVASSNIQIRRASLSVLQEFIGITRVAWGLKFLGCLEDHGGVSSPDVLVNFACTGAAIISDGALIRLWHHTVQVEMTPTGYRTCDAIQVQRGWTVLIRCGQLQRCHSGHWTHILPRSVIIDTLKEQSIMMYYLASSAANGLQSLDTIHGTWTVIMTLSACVLLLGGWYESDPRVPDWLQTSIRNSVITFEKQKVYRKKNGDLMRNALSTLIRGLCVGSPIAWPFVGNATAIRFLKTISDNSTSICGSVRFNATKTLDSILHCRLNGSADARAIGMNWMEGVLTRIPKEKLLTKRTLISYLSAIPTDYGFSCLVRICQVCYQENSHNRDLETRALCLQSGLRVFSKFLSSKHYSTENLDIIIIPVMGMVRSSARDYQTDKRGDVGSWVRAEAALAALFILENSTDLPPDHQTDLTNILCALSLDRRPSRQSAMASLALWKLYRPASFMADSHVFEPLSVDEPPATTEQNYFFRGALEHDVPLGSSRVFDIIHSSVREGFIGEDTGNDSERHYLHNKPVLTLLPPMVGRVLEPMEYARLSDIKAIREYRFSPCHPSISAYSSDHCLPIWGSASGVDLSEQGTVFSTMPSNFFSDPKITRSLLEAFCDDPQYSCLFTSDQFARVILDQFGNRSADLFHAQHKFVIDVFHASLIHSHPASCQENKEESILPQTVPSPLATLLSTIQDVSQHLWNDHDQSLSFLTRFFKSYLHFFSEIVTWRLISIRELIPLVRPLWPFLSAGVFEDESDVLSRPVVKGAPDIQRRQEVVKAWEILEFMSCIAIRMAFLCREYLREIPDDEVAQFVEECLISLLARCLSHPYPVLRNYAHSTFMIECSTLNDDDLPSCAPIKDIMSRNFDLVSYEAHLAELSHVLMPWVLCIK
eukprot:GHVH01017309.1.p1 GENE.GHVH01017309.1~~GHVH01017309.1.p1  ORF type:complete len:1218 (+),score=140.24 GHVH01017309.1:713-4366(+)